MNVSIFIDSLRYLDSFELLVSLASWINEVLTRIKYSSNKLLAAFHNGDHQVVSNIIHMTNSGKLIDLCFVMSFDYNISIEPFRFNVPMIKLLAKHGADVNRRDNFAVKQTIEIGHAEVLKILIDAGSYVPSELLSTAVEYGYLDMVKILLQNDTVQLERKYIIKCNIFTNEHAEIVKLFLSKGVREVKIKKGEANKPSKTIRMLRSNMQLN